MTPEAQVARIVYAAFCWIALIVAWRCAFMPALGRRYAAKLEDIRREAEDSRDAVGGESPTHDHLIDAIDAMIGAADHITLGTLVFTTFGLWATRSLPLIGDEAALSLIEDKTERRRMGMLIGRAAEATGLHLIVGSLPGLVLAAILFPVQAVIAMFRGASRPSFFSWLGRRPAAYYAPVR